MQGTCILGIYREEVFSPGKIQEDAGILDMTLSKLNQMGYKTISMRAEDISTKIVPPDLVLNMAQSEQVLGILLELQKSLIPVINSVQSVGNCYRKKLIPLLVKKGLPIPESRIVPINKLQKEGLPCNRSATYWLKRGDVHAMHARDVAHVSSDDDLISAVNHFHSQGVEDILVQEHVEGNTVKFYGVGPGEYFIAFSVATGEETEFQTNDLSRIARLSAMAAGLEIYGGDAIITPEGKVVLIDLNDWPSFSMCRGHAAEAIVRHAAHLINGGLHGETKHPKRDF